MASGATKPRLEVEKTRKGNNSPCPRLWGRAPVALTGLRKMVLGEGWPFPLVTAFDKLKPRCASNPGFSSLLHKKKASRIDWPKKNGARRGMVVPVGHCFRQAQASLRVEPGVLDAHVDLSIGMDDPEALAVVGCSSELELEDSSALGHHLGIHAEMDAPREMTRV